MAVLKAAQGDPGANPCLAGALCFLPKEIPRRKSGVRNALTLGLPALQRKLWVVCLEAPVAARDTWTSQLPTPGRT